MPSFNNLFHGFSEDIRIPDTFLRRFPVLYVRDQVLRLLVAFPNDRGDLRLDPLLIRLMEGAWAWIHTVFAAMTDQLRSSKEISVLSGKTMP